MAKSKELKENSENSEVLEGFALLDPNSDLAKNIAEAREAGFDAGIEQSDIKTYTFDKTGKYVGKDDLGDEVSLENPEGIILHVNYYGELWPASWSNNGPKHRPYIVAHDLKQGPNGTVTGLAYRVGEDVGTLDVAAIEAAEVEGQPGTYHYEKLPGTQFGTAENGGGKYAKEGYILTVLLKDQELPVRLKTSAGSIKYVKKFLADLFRKVGLPSKALVRFESAQASGGYSHTIARGVFVEKLTDAIHEQCKKLFGSNAALPTPAVANLEVKEVSEEAPF
ncbi:MAG: hypothetical protein ISR34_08070 [Pirellulales bacterium]|nr:hypothetical protein [Pirellulales bacterium]